jgi:alanyl-tRNA synthetase
VGDTGELANKKASFRVADTQARQSAHLHIGQVEQGGIRVGDRLAAHVDMERRHATMRNHSATHLLHAALKEVLGGHVKQKGSLVAPEYLRFDFSHAHPLTPEQRRAIEAVVNRQILANTPVETRMMSLDEAQQDGAVALFGEKYATEVRVLSMGEDGFSKELCGGTHVSRTGDIGLFRITDESASAAGVRRLEAVTGEAALDTVTQLEERLSRVSEAVRAPPEQAAERVEQMAERVRDQDKELERLKQKLAAGAGGDLAARAEEINGVKVLATKVEGADGKTLRNTLDKLKDKLGSSVIVLGAAGEDKVALVAGTTKDLAERYNAGELVQYVAEQVGGQGGGRPDMAQGGGNDPAALDQALASVRDWIAEKGA